MCRFFTVIFLSLGPSDSDLDHESWGYDSRPRVNSDLPGSTTVRTNRQSTPTTDAGGGGKPERSSYVV